MSNSRVRAGVGRIGGVQAAPGETPAQPAVDGAEGQIRPGVNAAFGRAARPAWWPRNTDRGPARCGLAPARDGRPPRSDSHSGAPRRSCQTMAAVAGFAGAAIPDDDRLPLVGDADRRHGLVERFQQLGHGGHHRRPDLFRVVLHPTGPGKVLGELPVAGRHRKAVLTHRHGPDSGRPGVDGDDHGHEKQTLVGPSTPVRISDGSIPGAAPRRRGGDKGAGARVLTAEGAASAAPIDSTPEEHGHNPKIRNFFGQPRSAKPARCGKVGDFPQVMHRNIWWRQPGHARRRSHSRRRTDRDSRAKAIRNQNANLREQSLTSTFSRARRLTPVELR